MTEINAFMLDDDRLASAIQGSQGDTSAASTVPGGDGSSGFTDALIAFQKMQQIMKKTPPRPPNLPSASGRSAPPSITAQRLQVPRGLTKV